MVEPAVKSSEWSTGAALRSVGWFLLVGALFAGWFWATADVDATRHEIAFLDTLSARASVALVVFCIPAGYLWIRGRRRAEDEAERAGRAIKDAQDEYDSRPRPVRMMFLFVLLLTCQLSSFAPTLLALIEDGPWLKAAVAGTIIGMVVLVAAFSLVRLLAEAYIASRKTLAGRQR